jgi:hypothetical protein
VLITGAAGVHVAATFPLTEAACRRRCDLVQEHEQVVLGGRPSLAVVNAFEPRADGRLEDRTDCEDRPGATQHANGILVEPIRRQRSDRLLRRAVKLPRPKAKPTAT